MKYFAISDVGNVRKVNEDSYDVSTLTDNALLAIVCDGMGGLSCGEVASALTVKTFRETVERLCRGRIKDGTLTLSDQDAYLILSNAATRANSAVMDYHRDHPEAADMGTTLVAALILDLGGHASVSWISLGDSRIYTVDHRDILQVSRDHSYVQYLLDMGEISASEAKRHPRRNVITRAIGIGDEIEPDIDTFPLSGEECAMTHVFLCTDGFSGALDEDDCMKKINDPEKNVEEKATELVAHIKEIDGSDNITLVVIDLGDIAHGKL